MKSIKLIMIFIFTSGTVFSQYVIKVSDSFENYSGLGNKKSVTVNIYDNNAETIKKEWAKLMSRTYFSDKAEWKTESFIDNVSIKSVSENTVDIYGTVKYSTDGVVTFSVAVDMGGIFMNDKDHPKSYEAVKKIMYDFALERSKTGLNEKIQDQQKLLETFKTDEVVIDSEIKGMQTEIIEYQNKISALQTEISAKQAAKLEKQNKIKAQQELLFKTMQITVK